MLFNEAVARQSEESAAALDRLETLRAHYEEILKGERTATRLLEVIDFLMGRPIATIRQVERGIQASDFTVARRYVSKLVELGILRETTGQQRDRIYKADQIMSAIKGTLEM